MRTTGSGAFGRRAPAFFAYPLRTTPAAQNRAWIRMEIPGAGEDDGLLMHPVTETQLPVVASYIATFLKPEMLHLHRQVTGLRRWKPVVITQRRENADLFPFEPVIVRRKPATRFLRAVWCKQIARCPIRAYASEARGIAAEIERSGASVLHVYFGHIGVYLLPLLRMRRLPAIVSFHGADAGVGMDRPTHRRAMAEMLTLADRILVRSESLAGSVGRLGAEPDRVRVHRTGLPLAEFPVVPRRAPETGAWHFVQASRLIAKKGIETALTAFAAFAHAHPQAHFTIAGSGPLETTLRATAGRLGVADRVTFAGFLDQDRLRALYASAHLFVHPSETGLDGDAEGVPNAMLEAMATGLPVVATRHGGIPEAVGDGISGWLVAERDAPGLADAMNRLTADHVEWERFGAAAAAAVRVRFDLAAQTAVLEGIYDEAAGRGRQ